MLNAFDNARNFQSARRNFDGLNMSLELDVDFDGTASDFAQVLENSAIKILELGSDFVKI